MKRITNYYTKYIPHNTKCKWSYNVSQAVIEVEIDDGRELLMVAVYISMISKDILDTLNDFSRRV